MAVALFASGSGSNAAALLDHRYTGAVRPHYRCLVGNNSAAPVMELARARGVPAYHVSRRTHPSRDAYLARLLEVLSLHGTQLIVLAGYLRLLPAEIVRRWRGRILNIHPALLPRHGGRGMYGMAPHRAVLAAGERETGVTVHLVDEEYDGGPIVLQRRVPVRADDSAQTLARRVLAVEHDTYWRAVEQVAAEVAAAPKHPAAGRLPAASGVPGARGSGPAEPGQRAAGSESAGDADGDGMPGAAREVRGARATEAVSVGAAGSARAAGTAACESGRTGTRGHARPRGANAEALR